MIGTDNNTWLHGHHPGLLHCSLKHALVSKLKRNINQIKRPEKLF